MTLTRAAEDVLAERHRQVEEEAWTPHHDDLLIYGELGKAAACYAHRRSAEMDQPRPVMWPFGTIWWKPSTYRRNLVKAGALILAEIERIDRAAQRDDETEGR